MRSLFVCFLLMLSLSCLAQPNFSSVQNRWIEAMNKDAAVKEMLFPEGYLLYADGNVLESGSKNVISGFGLDQQFSSYVQLQLFKHDEARYLTLGSVMYGENPYLLLTGWKKTGIIMWKKEIDVLLAMKSDISLADSIQQQLSDQRQEWIRLANRHEPFTHIQTSYAKDAVYFSNGDRSDGHAGISERYSYMENPGYRVDLEKEYLRKVSKKNVLEIGRYYTGKVRKGSGGLYVILWEKEKASEGWKIKLDFNF